MARPIPGRRQAVRRNGRHRHGRKYPSGRLFRPAVRPDLRPALPDQALVQGPRPDRSHSRSAARNRAPVLDRSARREGTRPPYRFRKRRGPQAFRLGLSRHALPAPRASLQRSRAFRAGKRQATGRAVRRRLFVFRTRMPQRKPDLRSARIRPAASLPSAVRPADHPHGLPEQLPAGPRHAASERNGIYRRRLFPDAPRRRQRGAAERNRLHVLRKRRKRRATAPRTRPGNTVRRIGDARPSPAGRFRTGPAPFADRLSRRNRRSISTKRTFASGPPPDPTRIAYSPAACFQAPTCATASSPIVGSSVAT